MVIVELLASSLFSRWGFAVSSLLLGYVVLRALDLAFLGMRYGSIWASLLQRGSLSSCCLPVTRVDSFEHRYLSRCELDAGSCWPSGSWFAWLAPQAKSYWPGPHNLRSPSPTFSVVRSRSCLCSITCQFCLLDELFSLSFLIQGLVRLTYTGHFLTSDSDSNFGIEFLGFHRPFWVERSASWPRCLC